MSDAAATTKTFYYVWWAVADDEGVVSMHASIYYAGGHASASFTFAPDHPHYDFWLWLIDRLWRQGEPEHGPFVSSDDVGRLRAEYEAERAARGGDGGDLVVHERVLGLLREAATERAARHQQPWWKTVGEVLLSPITLPFFILFVIVPDLFSGLKGLIRRSPSTRRE